MENGNVIVESEIFIDDLNNIFINEIVLDEFDSREGFLIIIIFLLFD